jgi:UTP--glucose-1-phosphate uridylyltransferase
MKIRKAIIPVAGIGTRFLPATKAQPKEMITLVDKPVIQYIVEEAVASGIEEITFVTSLGKRAIEDHFDRNFELEYRLRTKGKKKELGEILDISDMATFTYVRQRSPKGDGDAILSARHIIGDEPCAIMYGDDIMDSAKPALAQLMDVYQKYQDPVIGLYHVPTNELSRYGVVRGQKTEKQAYEITGFVEKPAPGKAPSNLIGAARYIITPEIFEILARLKPGKDGEIRLADAFIEFLRFRSLYGCEIKATRYDCGNKLGFLEAQIAFGLKHPETGAGLKKYLSKLGVSGGKR